MDEFDSVTTIWTKHNTQWRQMDKGKITTMQMLKPKRKQLTMLLNQTSAANVTLPTHIQAI